VSVLWTQILHRLEKIPIQTGWTEAFKGRVQPGRVILQTSKVTVQRKHGSQDVHVNSIGYDKFPYNLLGKPYVNGSELYL
jgi:hypothetical protein